MIDKTNMIRKQHGHSTTAESALSGIRDKIGVGIRNFIVPNTKRKLAVFGDIAVTASSAWNHKSIKTMRLHYAKGIDNRYPITAHIFAVGQEHEHVIMRTDMFIELLARVINSDPSHYMRSVEKRKDSDD